MRANNGTHYPPRAGFPDDQLRLDIPNCKHMSINGQTYEYTGPCHAARCICLGAAPSLAGLPRLHGQVTEAGNACCAFMKA
jgi:hypothetical protein